MGVEENVREGRRNTEVNRNNKMKKVRECNKLITKVMQIFGGRFPWIAEDYCESNVHWFVGYMKSIRKTIRNSVLVTFFVTGYEISFLCPGLMYFKNMEIKLCT